MLASLGADISLTRRRRVRVYRIFSHLFFCTQSLVGSESESSRKNLLSQGMWDHSEWGLRFWTEACIPFSTSLRCHFGTWGSDIVHLLVSHLSHLLFSAWLRPPWWGLATSVRLGNLGETFPMFIASINFADSAVNQIIRVKCTFLSREMDHIDLWSGLRLQSTIQHGLTVDSWS